MRSCGVATLNAYATACRDFEARPWPDDNPPEIVVSTLPPDADLPHALIDDVAACRSRDGRELRRAIDAWRSTFDATSSPATAMLEAQARASFDFWLAHSTGVERLISALAEREGFEPSRGLSPLLAFQASAFNRSTTSPGLNAVGERRANSSKRSWKKRALESRDVLRSR